LSNKENEIVEWIKELEERREKLDGQIDDLDREVAKIEWRTTQLEEFIRKLEEGGLQVNLSEVIAEKSKFWGKRLFGQREEKRKERDKITQEREFCNAFITYLRSQLEIS